MQYITGVYGQSPSRRNSTVLYAELGKINRFLSKKYKIRWKNLPPPPSSKISPPGGNSKKIYTPDELYQPNILSSDLLYTGGGKVAVVGVQGSVDFSCEDADVREDEDLDHVGSQLLVQVP